MVKNFGLIILKWFYFIYILVNYYLYFLINEIVNFIKFVFYCFDYYQYLKENLYIFSIKVSVVVVIDMYLKFVLGVFFK